MSETELARLLDALKLPAPDESLCGPEEGLLDPDVDALEIFGGL